MNRTTMLRLPSLLLLAAAFASGLGCTSTLPADAPANAPASAPPPEDRPPTPASVTHKNPGGDAVDPVKAALNRLLAEPFENKRRDRWRTLRVPLADQKNWRRIKIWGHPTRATFQYGDDHLALVTLRYTKVEGSNEPEKCLAEFMKYASPIADGYGIRLGESKLVKTTQTFRGDPRPVLVRLQEGSVDSILASDDYVGFVAAYQNWPGTCLVQGFAVVATDHPELAVKVRDRWVAEQVAALSWDAKVKEAPDTTLMR